MVKKPDNARIGEAVYRIAKELQEYISTLEKIRVPVIAAIQGGCVGGAKFPVAGPKGVVIKRSVMPAEITRASAQWRRVLLRALFQCFSFSLG